MGLDLSVTLGWQTLKNVGYSMSPVNRKKCGVFMTALLSPF